MRPLAHYGRGDALLAPAHSAPLGMTGLQPTRAQRKALDALWPSLRDKMVAKVGVSSDYVAERVPCPRSAAITYLRGRGCVRMAGKWRLKAFQKKPWTTG